jgi:hypothetical protein
VAVALGVLPYTLLMMQGTTQLRFYLNAGWPLRHYREEWEPDCRHTMGFTFHSVLNPVILSGTLSLATPMTK